LKRDIKKDEKRRLSDKERTGGRLTMNSRIMGNKKRGRMKRTREKEGLVRSK